MFFKWYPNKLAIRMAAKAKMVGEHLTGRNFMARPEPGRQSFSRGTPRNVRDGDEPLAGELQTDWSKVPGQGSVGRPLINQLVRWCQTILPPRPFARTQSSPFCERLTLLVNQECNWIPLDFRPGIYSASCTSRIVFPTYVLVRQRLASTLSSFEYCSMIRRFRFLHIFHSLFFSSFFSLSCISIISRGITKDARIYPSSYTLLSGTFIDIVIKCVTRDRYKHDPARNFLRD